MGVLEPVPGGYFPVPPVAVVPLGEVLPGVLVVPVGGVARPVAPGVIMPGVIMLGRGVALAVLAGVLLAKRLRPVGVVLKLLREALLPNFATLRLPAIAAVFGRLTAAGPNLREGMLMVAGRALKLRAAPKPRLMPPPPPPPPRIVAAVASSMAGARSIKAARAKAGGAIRFVRRMALRAVRMGILLECMV